MSNLYIYLVGVWQRFLQWLLRRYLIRWARLSDPPVMRTMLEVAQARDSAVVGFCDNDGVAITVPTLRQHDGRLLCSTCKKRQRG